MRRPPAPLPSSAVVALARVGALIGLTLASLAAVALPASAGHGAAPRVPLRSIDAPALKALLDGRRPLVLVDLRPAEEYRKGRLAGARSMSLDDPAERFREIARAPGTVVLYCDCPATELDPVYQFLRFAGHPHVLVLDGGWAAWVARGYPVER